MNNSIGGLNDTDLSKIDDRRSPVYPKRDYRR